MPPPIALLESSYMRMKWMQNEKIKSLEISSILKKVGHSKIKINLPFKFKNLL
jgi:hypothetical protein